MRKPIAYALFAVTGIAGLFFLLHAQKIVKNEAYYEAVSQYVYAHSGGAIGRDETVRVRFVNAAVSAEQVGQAVPANIFSVEPKIEGQAVWEDDRTIKLQPTASLKPGKKYTAQVALGKIYTDAPKAARVFEFDFRAKETSFDVVTEGISADPNDPKMQRIVGHVRVNEPCAGARVEKMLEAKQGNKALLVSWQHSADGLSHSWTVAGVERSNAQSKVNLHWSGEAIGVDKNLDNEQPVPAWDDFSVLSARAVQVEEQYVLLNFSDPIAAAQDLSGLIRLENYSGKLRYVTDGNFVRVYPGERLSGEYNLQVEKGIRNAAGQNLKERVSWPLTFEDLKPGVRLVGRGAVIPQQANGGIIFPFEAVGLNAVDVEVFKIFNSNILQFLQVNEIEGSEELERVGKIVLQKKIKLSDINPNASAKNWQRYAFDLKDMIRQDPGAIYQVRIAFQLNYTDCATGAGLTADASGMVSTEATQTIELNQRDDDGNLISVMGGWRGRYFSDNYWDDDYNWDNQENACSREFYNNQRFAQRNVFVSDLGLTAKRGRDGSLFVALTDLHSAQPVGGVDLELFTYQLQSITKSKTGSDGTVMIEGLRETPFLLVATGQNRRGYLRMADGNALSLSRFDVVGVEAQKGLKGYIYGERGVWRPGDSLFLDFVLEDKSGKLPAGHPVTMELNDPRGALQYRTVQTNSVDGVFPFHCATRADAPTGNWTAKVTVGGATFTKQLKIETVKPNRLKMDLNFGKKSLSPADENLKGTLKVNWLHGAVAQNLKSKVEMQVRSVKTEFSSYKTYVFDDPSRNFSSEPEVLFDANLDQNGVASVPLKVVDVENAPGKLIANFKVRAFEAGGDFSTDNFSLDFYPFDRYIGIFMPKGRWGDKTIDQRGGTVTFVMVDKTGKPLANQQINVALFRTDWRWWWDEDAESGVAQFNSSEFNNALDQTTLTTDSRGQATWKVKPDDWGRFLVRAVDTEGGHASGDFFWSGYPEDLNDIASRNAAAMLPFSAEKEKYSVGEEVTLKVPASENGRILLTLENGTRVAKHLWFDAKAGDNYLKFKAEESMSPTVYAHVSLIQPHAQTKNDLPIRMYGVTPVNIENPTARLTAQIDMPEVLKPDEYFNVSLRETGGKACTYTLAIVDEGLLDLTRFQTPNPFDAFYAREALGVKSWDIYDYVLGAYGAELERILAIGGDGINQKAKNAAQINRFKPCVIHLGPFKLEKGQTAKHRLKISNYVGSVRVMAVLSAPPSNGSAGAYGSAEKTCPVRKPLMILPTLPRVLGPGETLRLPVDVFAMEKSVQNANVSVREKSGLVNIEGAAQNTLNFAEPGEKMTYFDLKVGQKTGVAKFTITAQSGGESATAEIELLVRNPNPVTTTVWEGTIEAGADWSANFDPSKYSEMRTAAIEVSALPPINLSRHLDYLIQYPHGCVEQTTSTAFPQLYVDLLTPLSQKQKDDVSKNVSAAIGKLRGFQHSSGGFAYWRGSNDVNPWCSNYAGHFLLEAKNKGYAIPEGLIDRWIQNQTTRARDWNPNVTEYGGYHGYLTQAYRLYTLALAGKPDLADMNRLREDKNMWTQSAGLLAAAYAQAGKPEAARDILGQKWKEDFKYDYCGSTYGSDLRDRSLMLETYTMVGDNDKAQAMAGVITTEMGKQDGWYWNTQSLATGLRALSKYVSKNFGSGPAYAYRIGSGSPKTGDASRPVSLVDFTENALGTNGQINVKNNGAARLYARLVISAAPTTPSTAPTSSNLALSVRYTDLKGQAIDAAKVKQGSDFIAEITVKRSSGFTFDFNELALTQIFPSGWEITNARMDGAVSSITNSPMDYQDVRDDRVMTYFDLPRSTSPNQADARVYRIQLNAAYAGKYYLPAVACEAMYDNRIQASSPGKWVEVI
jgi:hypothetical protein